MQTKISPMLPQEAWKRLKTYKQDYYDSMNAVYSGDHDLLRATAENGTFWARSNAKCKIHVPIGADIAMTGSNLLFSKEPTYLLNHGNTEMNESQQQKRLEDVLMKNNMGNRLNEAAETAAAFGDVYIKLRWSSGRKYPLVDVVQPDCAWPEYLFGDLIFVHFFTPIITDQEKDVVVRAYECYERGRITMKMFSGSSCELGIPMPDSELEKIGYAPEIKVPVEDMIAVHIANVRPNRKYRSSMMGRSDMDGLRDMCDALDETYTSWMRDVRLAKARLIVPAEYLRRKPQSMIDGLANHASYEFDADVETYVAMDIDTDRVGIGITPSQFEIRSEQHEKTCSDLIRNILEYAGYSAQTFGISVETGAASGTALSIRERKSAATAYKKQSYWQAPLENILTSLVHLDSALYPEMGSHMEDTVSITYADPLGFDAASIASTIQLLYNGQSASTVTRVRMQHPEWSEEDIAKQVDRIRQEFNMVDEPNMLNGDYENPNAVSPASGQPPESADQPTAAPNEPEPDEGQELDSFGGGGE